MRSVAEMIAISRDGRFPAVYRKYPNKEACDAQGMAGDRCEADAGRGNDRRGDGQGLENQ